jgi:hypothetical protein
MQDIASNCISFVLNSKLADMDILPGAGHSDPYVRVYITQEGLTETLLKKGTKLSDNENPDWPDIYEFNYDVKKHPVS